VLLLVVMVLVLLLAAVAAVAAVAASVSKSQFVLKPAPLIVAKCWAMKFELEYTPLQKRHIRGCTGQYHGRL
jgi:hypothetical protein